jgi:hypothetical protein
MTRRLSDPLGQLGFTITPGGVTQALARTARRLQPTYAQAFTRAPDALPPPGRAVTGPDSPDPASDLKQEGCGQHGCGHWSGAPSSCWQWVVRSRD